LVLYAVIFRQSAAQARHSFAQAAICVSDGIFSHSAAQASHAFAQTSQFAIASESMRAISFADNPQKSWQVIAARAEETCSLCPSLAWVRQWLIMALQVLSQL